MAMKLDATEKAIDSAIRAYNKQLEQAFAKLGYDHTITRNLVSTARSIFGKDSVKTMTTKHVDKKNIDMSTGEYFETIQIRRDRATISKAKEKNLISLLNKAVKYENKTRNRELDKFNGSYKTMYNVSHAYNNAVEQVRAFHTANLPEHIKDAMKGKSVVEKDKILEGYLKTITHTDNIDIQLLYNDISSEVFATYAQARQEIDDNDDFDENFLRMQEFAQNYNTHNYNSELLYQARMARENWIYSQQYKNELDEIQGKHTFDEFNDLNIF